jgi:hypothetical protein
MISATKLKHLYYLILICNASIAQDSIFLRTRIIEVGKVSQIGGGSVLFMPDTFNADKVLVKYRATKIHKIKYASGRTDTVWGNPLYQNTSNLFVNYEFKHRHEFDISIYKIWNKNVLVQYNYYLPKRNFSISVPLNFIQNKYKRVNSSALFKPRFSTGIIIRTHSNRQSKFGFYAGIGLLTGYANLFSYDSRYGTENLGKRYFVNPIINFGYQHYINSLIYLNINSSFGPNIFPYYRKYDDTVFVLEGRIGFRIH